MAAQRIVLTSPWKLGLFVFVLVAGTGFGLIWTYMEIFGGQIDLRDEKVLRLAYMVLGGVAGLGLLGYIAVVSSARPLDRVVRQSRQREQLMKRFGKIQDPRMIDIEDFEDEPALKAVLERWSEQAAAASDARLNNASQNEALAQLTSQLRELEAGEFEPEIHESTPDLDALVGVIKGLVSNPRLEEPVRDFSRPVSAAAEPVADAGWTDERSTWRDAAEKLFICEQELEGFVRSVADHAAEIASRTGNLSKHSGALPREAAMAVENLRRNGLRMGKIKEASELLAEEANKLAMTIGVELSRTGDQNAELTGVADGLRTLSTQYQRIAAEVEIARADQNESLDSVMNMEVTTLDSASANALAQQAMALDQHAEALSELLTRFRRPMEQIRNVAPEIAAAIPARHSRPVAVPKPGSYEAPQVHSTPVAPLPVEPTPIVEPMNLEEPSADTRDFGMADASARDEGAKIYDIAELGGRELAAEVNGQAPQNEDRVYDLDELGAVEL